MGLSYLTISTPPKLKRRKLVLLGYQLLAISYQQKDYFYKVLGFYFGESIIKILIQSRKFIGN